MKYIKTFESIRRRFTELEDHIIDSFRNDSENFNDLDPGFLKEFADGYKTLARRGEFKYSYSMDKGDDELISEFISIVKLDTEGQLEYKASDCELIEKCIRRFGL